MNNNKEPGIAIRTAGIDDAPVITELGARTFYETFAEQNTSENMKAYLAKSFGVEKQAMELADGTSIFLIAEIDGAPAGYAMMIHGSRSATVSGAHPMEIARIYALREWIGRGVGAALMRACLEESAKRGCDTIWLGVWEHNPRAIAFYRKWGFVEVGTQPFQLGDDPQTDVVMQRAV